MTKSKLPAASSRREIDTFLEKVSKTPVSNLPGDRGRLIFAMDATASRQPAWDSACQIQGDMFLETDKLIDPTRGVEAGNPDRNGEPDGELGLVTQKDDAWQDQTGAPDDPQPGNIPGGARDVLRGASFNISGNNDPNGQINGFAADSGSWTVEEGRLSISPEQLGGDAASLFYVDSYLPSYFEIEAGGQVRRNAAWTYLRPLPGFEALAGYIAYAIADRPGIAPGFVMGAIAGTLNTGFLGGIIGHGRGNGRFGNITGTIGLHWIWTPLAITLISIRDTGLKQFSNPGKSLLYSVFSRTSTKTS